MRLKNTDSSIPNVNRSRHGGREHGLMSSDSTEYDEIDAISDASSLSLREEVTYFVERDFVEVTLQVTLILVEEKFGLLEVLFMYFVGSS